MLLDRKKYKEEAHIGEEFFQDRAYELECQCMTVESVVQRKILSIPEALEAYGVTEEQFVSYLAKKFKDSIENILHTKNGAIDISMYLRFMMNLFHEVLGENHLKNVNRLDRFIIKLSDEITAQDRANRHEKAAG